MYKILDQFDFGPDLSFHFRITCPSMTQIMLSAHELVIFFFIQSSSDMQVAAYP